MAAASIGWWLIPALVVVGLVALVLAWRPLRGILHEIQAERARELFALQREWLEAKFIDMAAASGKPRGLRWKDCEWESPVKFARERKTGQLTALVGVAVAFEAVAGSDMEGLPSVGNLRNATAIFFFHRGQWHTTGRALFNMNPDEALDRFKAQYEPVEMG
jgi:hypothetical protein